METLENILAHQKAYNERLYLVASENSLSFTARLAFLTDVLNRYYFPLETHRNWAFPGNEHIEKIYARCRELLAEVTGARFVSIRPISGVNAMTVALAGLTRPGDAVATVSPANGGHKITAAIARRLGLRVAHLPYVQEDFTVDTEALPAFIAREKPSLIYLDQCHILFTFNLREMRRAIPDAVKIYYDGSHVMGLILGNNFQDPLREGAAFLGGSTHKSIPGPQKAFIASNDEKDWAKIEAASRVFVSHDHGGDVAALAIVLEEMRPRWKDYANLVVDNARYLASALSERGFTVIGKDRGFSRSHQIWIDIAPYSEAFAAAQTLARCNVIINTIEMPAVSDRLILRAAVHEVTYCGAAKDTMREIANIFEEVFITKRSSEEKVREQVRELKKGLIPPVDEDALGNVMELLRQKSK